jgi:thioredoxin reductase (NADPH)
MSDELLLQLIAMVVIVVPIIIYVLHIKKQEERIRKAAEAGTLYSTGPKAQHPQFDLSKCIGCGACVRVCPEGQVLAVIAGKASIINPQKCVGHGLCEEACPVGAILMVMAPPSQSADLPYMTPDHETNIPNLFIAGELGGLALIKNAVNQGREIIDTITKRKSAAASAESAEIYDVCIIGAGPAGISASLRASENKLRYLTLEQDAIGGTVSKYPRQKLVMTSPVQFPLYGKFSKMTLSKEEMLAFWNDIARRADFQARTGERVDDIKKDPKGIFTVVTQKEQYCASAVILALGRTGTPNKLGVKGEQLPKVMYSLIETEAYTGKNILVVGGGDSAVEAALGLAIQKGNRVWLSYRKERFSRIKERNALRIEESMHSGKIQVLFNSKPVEIKERTVILECNDALQEIENDFVWVFAGGIPPNAFLEKVGVKFGMQALKTIDPNALS